MQINEDLHYVHPFSYGPLGLSSPSYLQCHGKQNHPLLSEQLCLQSAHQEVSIERPVFHGRDKHQACSVAPAAELKKETKIRVLSVWEFFLGNVIACPIYFYNILQIFYRQVF